MKISTDDIRQLPRFPQWKLYFKIFPACVHVNHRWPIAEGVRVSYAIIARASDHSEGTISITFLDDPSKKVRHFLHDWQEGVWEAGTGKQQPMKDLLASVAFRDENAIEPDLNVFLKFPTDCDIDSETPSFRVVYYE
ncbi:MAG: hypothetical protein NT140_06815 [Deltaproteobacteria bacterium]|nr:hypothetical protein [Deltaproteobacteria bacterium]